MVGPGAAKQARMLGGRKCRSGSCYGYCHFDHHAQRQVEKASLRRELEQEEMWWYIDLDDYWGGE